LIEDGIEPVRPDPLKFLIKKENKYLKKNNNKCINKCINKLFLQLFINMILWNSYKYSSLLSWPKVSGILLLIEQPGNSLNLQQLIIKKY